LAFTFEPVVQFGRFCGDKLRRLIKQLVDLDVVLVMAVGNYREYSEEVNEYPQLYAQEFENIILVGAVDNNGHRLDFSQGGPSVKIYAPGIVQCARNSTGVIYQAGTSVAAPQVAALADYFISTQRRLRTPGFVAARTAAYLWEKAYPRVSVGPPALWNGEYSNTFCQTSKPWFKFW
jgi:subtilisin family serine protease